MRRTLNQPIVLDHQHLDFAVSNIQDGSGERPAIGTRLCLQPGRMQIGLHAIEKGQCGALRLGNHDRPDIRLELECRLEIFIEGEFVEQKQEPTADAASA